MDTFLFSCFAAAYLILFSLALHLFKKRRIISAALLLPVIAGLVYDNGIIATGRFIGEGAALETLNAARFWLRALFTPLLVLYAWMSLKQAGVTWAHRGWFRLVAIALTVALVLLELFTEVRGLLLQPRWEYGTLSYTNAESSGGPPLMVLVVSIVLLADSVLVWRKQRWVWFFIGSLVMIVGSAVQLPVASGAVTNLFELVLIVSLLATAWFQGNDRRAEPQAK
ncbi:hypothetical protein RRU94_10890 [Domibacillus sp. DTU_2020_1001157_1_SI_ALB_TIR_016]|uniref:hypothetical protein n=1 Tax=Domibacillus sp. DTU_2020_1001157_1_SI_ALB_TIR_016 TaxID=3077789 RepID=UPI0028E8D33B|nr:hypothetical protein [Domibacillus sp. DTU_2020_1001157_1_SI_ALB_TIR_016]WNS81305.1 hypothetical protein RRU94_10890 [Domibacillus sp. DTU_2020_1001157_1_SI_ALB_TIR_016]